jgi:uncharacterized protein (DUF58 family)
MPADRPVFPLIPKQRLIGLAFGAVESVRRGRGFDVAGSRPYRPGDPVESIDWKASARLATARGTDEFVVLERHAEEAPRVVVVCDRRPEMALYPARSPWLSKADAMRGAVALIVASAHAAHGFFGYLDLAGGGTEGGKGFWRPPRTEAELWDVEARLESPAFDAPGDNLTHALDRLTQLRRDLPAGSFVFVISDFLAPPSSEAWWRAQARRWELVPVIVQDPVWEQDFPDIASIVTPVADPVTGRVRYVRLSEDEVAARRTANRTRLAELRAELEARGSIPIVLSSSDSEAILQAFLDWGEQRGSERGRVW